MVPEGNLKALSMADFTTNFWNHNAIAELKKSRNVSHLIKVDAVLSNCLENSETPAHEVEIKVFFSMI